MKILLYPVKLHHQQMESHSLPLMLITLPIAERGRDVKEIETGKVVVAIGTGTEIGIVVIVIAPESQMTIITTRNNGGGSMNETTITGIEAMMNIRDLDGMKMSIVQGIVIVMSAIGTGNPDQAETTGTGAGTGARTGARTEGTETEEGRTEETGRGIETRRGEKETGKGNEETGRNLINHIPRQWCHLMKALHLRRQQMVTIPDPSSKKCLLLTLAAVVLYLNIQKQKKKELDLFFSMT